MSDLAFQTVGALGHMLRGHEVSAVDLARYHLDRLERLGPRFNAVVTVLRDPAVAEAAERAPGTPARSVVRGGTGSRSRCDNTAPAVGPMKGG